MLILQPLRLLNSNMTTEKPKKKPALRVGTKVRYAPLFGQSLYGKITGSGTKNGQKIYDFESNTGDLRWGYRDQFEVIHN